MQQAGGQNLLERREYKFLIPESKVAQIRRAATTVCQLDAHAGQGGSYPIRSLYLDTDRLDLFWANEREQVDRFKVRVRTYPGAVDRVWLEVKRRVNDVIVKTRASVSMRDWVELVHCPTALAHAKWQGSTRLYGERFVRLVHSHDLQPTVLVEYWREAYFSTVDDYARVTFDRRITCQRKDRWDMAADPGAWRPVDHPFRTWTWQPMCVLELKFGVTAPRWMVSMVRRFDLTRYAFSKYCYSVEAQHTLPRANVAGIEARVG